MDSEEKLEIATKKKLGEIEIKNSLKVEGEVDAPISKILTLNANVEVENVHSENAQAKISGQIVYNLLVAQGENIVNVTKKAPFAETFSNEGITANSTLFAVSKIQDVFSSIGSSEEVSVGCVANVDIWQIKTDEDFCCAKGGDEIFTKESEFSYSTLSNHVVQKFVHTFDLPKDAKMSKVLLFKNFATIKSVVPSTDYFVVGGDVFSTIVFQTEDGLVRSVSKEMNFQQEIEATGTTKESVVQAQICACDGSVEELENSKFVFEIPLVVDAQVYSQVVGSCVVDAYSTTHEVNLTTTSFEQNDFVATRDAEENLLTNFQLSPDVAGIDKILATIPTKIVCANQIVKTGEVVVEGIASLNIIYYSEDDDGNKLINSADVDLPFSIAFAVADCTAESDVCLTLCVGDVSVKSKHGRELEILAEIKANFNLTNAKTCAVTTKIEIGEERPQKDYALEIFLTKNNDTIWSVAKQLGVSTSTLLAQNKNLADPLVAGEKVVVYNKNSNG